MVGEYHPTVALHHVARYALALVKADAGDEGELAAIEVVDSALVGDHQHPALPGECALVADTVRHARQAVGIMNEGLVLGAEEHLVRRDAVEMDDGRGAEIVLVELLHAEVSVAIVHPEGTIALAPQPDGAGCGEFGTGVVTCSFSIAEIVVGIACVHVDTGEKLGRGVDPQFLVLSVFHDVLHPTVHNGGGQTVVAVDGHLVAVVAHESVVSAEPKEPLLVLEHGVDRVGGKSILQGYLLGTHLYGQRHQVGLGSAVSLWALFPNGFLVLAVACRQDKKRHEKACYSEYISLQACIIFGLIFAKIMRMGGIRNLFGRFFNSVPNRRGTSEGNVRTF